MTVIRFGTQKPGKKWTKAPTCTLIDGIAAAMYFWGPRGFQPQPHIGHMDCPASRPLILGSRGSRGGRLDRKAPAGGIYIFMHAIERRGAAMGATGRPASARDGTAVLAAEGRSALALLVGYPLERQ